MELGDGGGGGGGGDGGGGESESEANHMRLSSDDHLSALPDDALVVILLKLSTRDAVRTSVLSHRWRHVWALLPGLAFNSDTNPHQIASTLQAHEAALECLLVSSRNATAESVAAWLPIAAQCLFGRLYFHNLEQERIGQEGDEEIAQEGDTDDEEEEEEEEEEEDEDEDEEDEDEDEYDEDEDEDDEDEEEEEEVEEAIQRGAFELPCLKYATLVSLHLGFLRFTVPAAGIFTRLRELWLSSARLQGPGLLGDIISWPRCPCLQRLTICDTRGLDNLAIHSNSLQEIDLTEVHALLQLTIVAPALEVLKVKRCFYYSWTQPVASITAPQLGTLFWSDLYDPSSVHLGKMEHLRLLNPFVFIVYGNNGVTLNPSCLSLLRRFKVIEHLILTLSYQQINMDSNQQYMMEHMTVLPDITILHLYIHANGHCFGASAFHVIRMCSGIRRLMLTLDEAEEQTTCPPSCICIQQQNWETEHLLLNRLEEVEIDHFRGSEHEFAFVKKLFVWATALEKMKVNFHDSVTETVAMELGQVLHSFSRQETRLEIARVRI